MKSINGKLLPAVVAATLLSVPGVGAADAYIQCPGDSDGDAVIDLASRILSGRPPVNQLCFSRCFRHASTRSRVVTCFT